jgi:outer membrane protein
MRKLFVPLIAVAGLFAVAAPLSAQSVKIGYIDTRRVIQEAPGAVEARSTIEKEMQGFQKQLQAMQDSVQAMLTDYQQKSLVMSADAKQKREQEILQKRQSFEQRAQGLNEQAQKRQQELMQPIMTKVEQTISDIRKAEGFGIIFDIAAEAIVSADPALDITTKVIERMRATAPTAARKP